MAQARMITITMTADQARVLRHMVTQHLEPMQGDGSLSDDEDDLLVGLNQLILQNTEHL